MNISLPTGPTPNLTGKGKARRGGGEASKIYENALEDKTIQDNTVEYKTMCHKIVFIPRTKTKMFTHHMHINTYKMDINQ